MFERNAQAPVSISFPSLSPKSFRRDDSRCCVRTWGMEKSSPQSRGGYFTTKRWTTNYFILTSIQTWNLYIELSRNIAKVSLRTECSYAKLVYVNNLCLVWSFHQEISNEFKSSSLVLKVTWTTFPYLFFPRQIITSTSTQTKPISAQPHNYY